MGPRLTQLEPREFSSEQNGLWPFQNCYHHRSLRRTWATSQAIGWKAVKLSMELTNHSLTTSREKTASENKKGEGQTTLVLQGKHLPPYLSYTSHIIIWQISKAKQKDNYHLVAQSTAPTSDENEGALQPSGKTRPSQGTRREGIQPACTISQGNTIAPLRRRCLMLPLRRRIFHSTVIIRCLLCARAIC